MDIILSIYPKNIEKMASGVKKFEFRRCIYKDKTVKKAYVYATVPIKKIVATFDIIQVIEGSPEEVWNRCGQDSGSTKGSLMNYFKGKNLVYALKVGNFKWLKYPIDPREYIDKFYPPQFFQYVDGERIFKL
ncbi:hypothetical protein [Clostridium sp.]|uniref:hypothetical protein n=1 Tax=Clostridium sp. TaxID=1506 RepID=UPI00261D7AB0